MIHLGPVHIHIPYIHIPYIHIPYTFESEFCTQQLIDMFSLTACLGCRTYLHWFYFMPELPSSFNFYYFISSSNEIQARPSKFKIAVKVHLRRLVITLGAHFWAEHYHCEICVFPGFEYWRQNLDRERGRDGIVFFCACSAAGGNFETLLRRLDRTVWPKWDPHMADLAELLSLIIWDDSISDTSLFSP